MSVEKVNYPITEPGYYHREYSNDLPQESSSNDFLYQCKRVGFVALPFLSLYKPLSFHLSLTMGGLRSITCFSQLVDALHQGNIDQSIYAFIQTTIALISVSGTILVHPLGMLVTTIHDCTLDIISLGQHSLAGEFQSALGNTGNLINNVLYLALFTHGGIELAIASFAMQILLGITHSVSEYRKGNYLEAGGHFLMGMIRGNQLASQIQLLQMRWEIQQALDNSRKMRTTIRAESNKNELKFNSDINLNTSYEDNRTLADILLEYGGDKEGWTAMANAVKSNDFYAVQLLIENKANPEIVVPNHGNSIDIAIEYDRLEIMTYLLKLGYQIHAQGVYHACENNQIHVLEILEKYSQLEQFKGGSSLYQMIQSKASDESIMFLIEAGAECSFTDPFKVSSGCLTVALNSFRKLPLIKSLVAHGAPINTNIEIHPSYNPLQLAISHRRVDICEYLLSIGAKFPERDGKIDESMFALDIEYLLWSKSFDLVLVLSKYFECIDLSCMRYLDHGKEYKLTPLQAAALFGNLDAIEKIVDRGANINKKGNYKTPLKILLENGFQKAAEFLINSGAEIIDT